MSAVLAPGASAPQPCAAADVGLLGQAADRAVPLAAFLDDVAGILRAGLPERLWLAATVVAVRVTATGHTLELSDPSQRAEASLRFFLTSGSLAAIRRALGLGFDPALLIGMTTDICSCAQASPAAGTSAAGSRPCPATSPPACGRACWSG